MLYFYWVNIESKYNYIRCLLPEYPFDSNIECICQNRPFYDNCGPTVIRDNCGWENDDLAKKS
jgi:hypothetical protein